MKRDRRFFNAWLKRRRDRADLAATSLQARPDIGLPSAAAGSSVAIAGGYRDQPMLCARSNLLRDIVSSDGASAGSTDPATVMPASPIT